MIEFKLKKGATFYARITYVNPLGGSPDITGMTITSSVQNNNINYPLTVTVTNAALGQFNLTANTSSWPLGTYKWDIKYSAGGITSYQDTHYFQITEAVTP